MFWIEIQDKLPTALHSKMKNNTDSNSPNVLPSCNLQLFLIHDEQLCRQLAYSIGARVGSQIKIQKQREKSWKKRERLKTLQTNVKPANRAGVLSRSMRKQRETFQWLALKVWSLNKLRTFEIKSRFQTEVSSSRRWLLPTIPPRSANKRSCERAWYIRVLHWGVSSNNIISAVAGSI